jgi:hypothetical protein
MPWKRVAQFPPAEALPRPCQNSRSCGRRWLGVFPAISAPLMAPIEVRITQSGSMRALERASKTPAW